jgi:hypothetical protein
MDTMPTWMGIHYVEKIVLVLPRPHVGTQLSSMHEHWWIGAHWQRDPRAQTKQKVTGWWNRQRTGYRHASYMYLSALRSRQDSWHLWQTPKNQTSLLHQNNPVKYIHTGSNSEVMHYVLHTLKAPSSPKCELSTSDEKSLWWIDVRCSNVH